MIKTEYGVLFTDNETDNLVRVLRLVSSMHAYPFEEYMGCDFEEECEEGDKLYFEMKCKGICI